MMKASEHITIIYTNHDANTTIVAQISLSITNIDKLNLKLIRASIYLSQFRVEIRHRSDKSNIVLDALSRLSTKSLSAFDSLDLRNLNIVVKDSSNSNFVESETLTVISNEFKQKLIQNYVNES
jgi:hypothetical protein